MYLCLGAMYANSKAAKGARNSRYPTACFSFRSFSHLCVCGLMDQSFRTSCCHLGGHLSAASRDDVFPPLEIRQVYIGEGGVRGSFKQLTVAYHAE